MQNAAASTKSARWTERFFGNLSRKMVGQDVERGSVVPGSRHNSNVAAIAHSHTAQGVTALGIGR
ncbi:hypothetical protein M3A96_11535 [Helcobacillus massiliensis]|uniref:Uncharacterized protein n=1 Tax=Helcobacillus massiliensis TaxID=521392 RepID=A0A839QWC3_9MICO|nr:MULTISPECIES: hypothetical protein [Helcobacillus]MBB3023080.1 hypothetical protein [Helcobacillus massiliensis]MCG7426093.1 hypothetical protein [Helcobacillus sp. ACRRO]MCT1558741.1 hypothetical protein [Helcobacillus massiliensis]MCT2037467.1 hypothetical protein [Helcobacillus massiliensis]MCT2332967.1 hypothetical protein [Helcobacillus massiliensis]